MDDARCCRPDAGLHSDVDSHGTIAGISLFPDTVKVVLFYCVVATVMVVGKGAPCQTVRTQGVAGKAHRELSKRYK